MTRQAIALKTYRNNITQYSNHFVGMNGWQTEYQRSNVHTCNRNRVFKTFACDIATKWMTTGRIKLWIFLQNMPSHNIFVNSTLNMPSHIIFFNNALNQLQRLDPQFAKSTQEASTKIFNENNNSKIILLSYQHWAIDSLQLLISLVSWP